jgi:hypothetical protein
MHDAADTRLGTAAVEAMMPLTERAVALLGALLEHSVVSANAAENSGIDEYRWRI